MREALTEIGGLTTRVVDDLPEGESPRLGVVLCHGFGAPGDDLAPIGAGMARSSPTLAGAARFYFPQGLLDLSHYGMFGSRAWWLIDLEAIQRAMAEGTFAPRMRNDRPEGLEQARMALLDLAAHARKECGRIALGGFSQGAMLATDVAMHLEETPAALIQWSSTLLNEEEWRRLAPRHRRMKVVQSHGRQDPILPYAWAENLRDVMVECGFDVGFLPFDGPHTIPTKAFERAVQVLAAAV